MNLKHLLSFIVAAAVLTFAEARDSGPVVITHVVDAKKTTATIRFTEEIKIVLPTPADAPPAYEWVIMSNDSRILRLTKSPRPSGPADKSTAEKSPAPAANTWTTTFVALRPGRSIVRFVYVPAANNTVETPIDSREIVVNVR